MREVAIVGVGMHPWGRFPDKTFVDMGAEAALEALRDAGLDWQEVQTMVAGIWVWGSLSGLNPGPLLASSLGETGIPIVNVYTQCATATDTVWTAYHLIASGRYDIALAIGLDKSPKGFFSFAANQINPDPTDSDSMRWKMVGLTNPAYWAMQCRKRMAEYGTTSRDLARAKVICSKLGTLNPRALYRKVFTEEEVMAAPMVCDPLTQLMICAVRDGAAAAVLCSMDVAKRLTAQPVTIAGIGHGSPLYGDPTMCLGYLSGPVPGTAPLISESWVAARSAYEQAGIGPEDVDVAEIPDNSSWHYLQYPETLGFCKPGEMEGLLAAGISRIRGKTQINPSGGVACSGEAVAATGLGQIYELVGQLRGQCGTRQVEGAKVAMGQTYGMMGNSASIILKR